MGRLSRATLAVLACGVAATTAAAHSLSPSLLSLRERAGGVVEVTWKTPMLRLMGADPRPTLPPECSVTSPAVVSEESDGVIATWTVDCGTRGLVGREVAIEGLGISKTDALLHVELEGQDPFGRLPDDSEDEGESTCDPHQGQVQPAAHSLIIGRIAGGARRDERSIFEPRGPRVRPPSGRM